MRRLKPNLRSIFGLLGQTGPMTEPAMELRTEDVRQAMLDAMTACGLEELHPNIVRRISYADDIQALWYARGDVMTALASARGEAFAQEAMAVLSRLFYGLLPEANNHRKSQRQR